jgi:hypothetical protein
MYSEWWSMQESGPWGVAGGSAHLRDGGRQVQPMLASTAGCICVTKLGSQLAGQAVWSCPHRGRGRRRTL